MTRSLFLLLCSLCVYTPANAQSPANDSDKSPEPTAEQLAASLNKQPEVPGEIPVVRDNVFKLLNKAQSESDQGFPDRGLYLLGLLSKRLHHMNSHERAIFWRFNGYIHYGQDRPEQAITAFEKVIAQENIPQDMRQKTLYALAQLYLVTKNAKLSLSTLKRWQLNETVPLQAKDYILYGHAYYQEKQYQNALDNIQKALDLTQSAQVKPKESWLILQRATYYELEDSENVTKVLEQLVTLFNRPKYWVELANMYGELEQSDKQLATLESAWQGGYLTTGRDISYMAQLYMFYGLPYKAATLIEQAFEKQLITKNEKYVHSQVQALLLAKESDKAIPVLQEAIKSTKDGNMDAQLAEIYLNQQNWQLALSHCETALKKGGLKHPGQVYMIKGIAFFNLERFEKSLASFTTAKNFKRTQQLAQGWYEYASKEFENFKLLNPDL